MTQNKVIKFLGFCWSHIRSKPWLSVPIIGLILGVVVSFTEIQTSAFVIGSLAFVILADLAGSMIVSITGGIGKSTFTGNSILPKSLTYILFVISILMVALIGLYFEGAAESWLKVENSDLGVSMFIGVGTAAILYIYMALRYYGKWWIIT